jgi:hypothetical protein
MSHGAPQHRDDVKTAAIKGDCAARTMFESHARDRAAPLCMKRIWRDIFTLLQTPKYGRVEPLFIFCR